MNRLALILVLLVAGCGGGGGSKPLFTRQLGEWTVEVSKDGKAAAERDGKASPGTIELRPLGPDPGSTAGPQPQVAVEIKAPAAIESPTLWVDDNVLLTKGAGPSNRFISIYGAPGKLGPGEHRVVAFAQAGGHGAAATWTFSVG